MKKISLLLLAIFATGQTVPSRDYQSSSIFSAFMNKARLSDEESLAALKLVQCIPASDEPFDLSIKSKQNEICYELKSNKNYVYNCMDKKRTAELMMTYIQVCIEEKRDAELKKAKQLLLDLLNASEGSSFTMNSNGFPEKGAERSIKFDSPAFSVHASNSKNKDSNNPNLTNTQKLVVKSNINDLAIKGELEQKGSIYHLSKETKADFTLEDKKDNYSVQFSATHDVQPPFDSKDGLHHEKTTLTYKQNNEKTGPVVFTAQEILQGTSRWNTHSERTINLTTTNSTTNAEWSADGSNEITSHNVASKYKKAEAKNN
jgi:hypothetical protein